MSLKPGSYELSQYELNSEIQRLTSLYNQNKASINDTYRLKRLAIQSAIRFPSPQSLQMKRWVSSGGFARAYPGAYPPPPKTAPDTQKVRQEASFQWPQSELDYGQKRTPWDSPNYSGSNRDSWRFATNYGTQLPASQDEGRALGVMRKGQQTVLNAPLKILGRALDFGGIRQSLVNAGTSQQGLDEYDSTMGMLYASLLGAAGEGIGGVVAKMGQFANTGLEAQQYASSGLAAMQPNATTGDYANFLFNFVPGLGGKALSKYKELKGARGAPLGEALTSGEHVTQSTIHSDIPEKSGNFVADQSSTPEYRKPEDVYRNTSPTMGKGRKGIIAAIDQEVMFRTIPPKEAVFLKKWIRNLPEQLINDLTINFRNGGEIELENAIKGRYDPNGNRIATIMRETHPQRIIGTIIHEMAHDMQNYMSSQELHLLEEEFENAKAKFKASGASAEDLRRYANVNEWWAENVKDLVQRSWENPSILQRTFTGAREIIARHARNVLQKFGFAMRILQPEIEKTRTGTVYEDITGLNASTGRSAGKGSFTRQIPSPNVGLRSLQKYAEPWPR